MYGTVAVTVITGITVVFVFKKNAFYMPNLVNEVVFGRLGELFLSNELDGDGLGGTGSRPGLEDPARGPAANFILDNVVVDRGGTARHLSISNGTH